MTQQQIEQMRVNSIRQGLTMYGEYVAGVMDASEWQRKHDIDKACKEYCRTCRLYNDMIGDDCECNQLKDFRKAMEE